MKQLTAFICTLLLATSMGFAQTKTIHVTPDKAKIYVDGSEVGNGSYTLKFNSRTDFYMLKCTDSDQRNINRQLSIVSYRPTTGDCFGCDAAAMDCAVCAAEHPRASVGNT